jgi:chromosome partitioning protein
MGYSPGKIRNVFASRLSDLEFQESFRSLDLPINKPVDVTDLPRVGERVGFLPKLHTPTCMSVFVTKGGVLKTTLTMNMARMAALHNIRTVVVGLDMQGDVTQALGVDTEAEVSDTADLDSALREMNAINGLNELYTLRANLKDLIRPTDLPTLQLIPETPELVLLTQQLQLRNRREYWLKENVVDILKKDFDLILLDCSPNWNLLTTNALIASDVLLSPVECKINNFRNIRVFQSFIEEFKKDFTSQMSHFYVPTRLSVQRRLSQEILEWYQANLPECLGPAVKEGLTGEEASALHLSVAEYAPKTPAAQEMRDLITNIFARIRQTQSKQYPERQALA